MASGTIKRKNNLTVTGSVANVTAGSTFKSSISGGSGGGSSDHNRLLNREADDQHPIEAITGLRKELDSKLDSKTALPLIDEAISGKAKGLYFDAMKQLARKSYWYLTSEIDPNTKMGTKDSVISGPYDLGAGGGGGGGGVTTITVKPYEWPTTVVVGAKTELTVNWSSTIGEDKSPTGAGTLYLTVNAKQVEVRSNVEQGLVTFDVTKYIIAGTNNIQVKVLDMYGTTGITVSTVNAVTLELKSDFNADLSYTGTINYTYTPYGDVEKTVYFVVDGTTRGSQKVKSTGESQTYQLSGLSHGSHTFEVYFTAIVGSSIVRSNSLFYDLIYYIPGNTTPIIASTFNAFEQEQYISFNIPYRVFIYDRNSFDVKLSVNGELYQSLTVGTAVQAWNYKNDEPGNYSLEIACGKTKKTFQIHINKSSVDLVPVAADLALGLTTQGRSNAEPVEQRNTWKDETNDISCELSNFNWSSNGWVQDAEGNTVLRVSGDARIKIPYKPFEEDFKTRGKTIELEIATSAVRNYSATIISCLDKSRTDFYTAEPSFVDDETRLNAFSVTVNTEKIKEVGLPLGDHVINYTSNGWVYDKIVIDPAAWGLTIEEQLLNVEGEEGPAIRVGDNIKISYSLQARGFYVTPQIAAIRSQQSALSSQYKEDEHVRLTFVIERNTANRIIWMYIDGIASGACQYPIDDSFRQLDPDIIEIGSNDVILDIYNIRIYDNSLNSRQVVNNWIADTQDASLRVQRYSRNNNYNDKNEIIISQLPADLPYIIWDIDPLPEYKGDKRMGNARYVDPANPERNWTANVAEFNVQGTSSSVYPTKNIRLRMRSKNGAGYTWHNDEGDEISKFPITYPGGIGANYFTFKVDFASSESANNVELTRLYNEAAMAAGIFTPPQREELLKNGGDVSKVTTRVGIDGFPIAAFHQDKDGNVKFRTKANFNNDKANEDVYGFADGDESWEIANNSAAEGKFQVPITVDNFEKGLEIRFPDEDGYNDMSKLGPMSAWVASTYRAEATNELFDEPKTFEYEETTKAEDGSFSKVKVTKTFDADTEEYRLTKFKAELADWFNVDATLFYYIFTLLFLMIDSRAKNAFPTYFKSRTADDGGDRWFWLPYDMDTALGIDNKGKLTFDYNLEDFDQLDGADVYNGQDSVMWTNVRDAFAGEIAEMYATLRTQRLLSYDNVEKMFTEHQSKWTESIFNEDASIKYVTPLQNGDNYLEMLQGSKKQQRKWWLYNRFKYMDSKFNAGDAKADFIQFRAYVDAGVEKPNITITPYADIYATVSYANSAVGTKAKRAKRNEPIIIENPFGINEQQNDQETYIYSASQLKSIGDISPFHPDTVKIGNAVKLQDLKVGDASPDYSNPYLKELTVGNNALLRTLDARNCVNLTQAIDISKCINIEEIYFSGTKITGITLPDGGNIKSLHLPETLTKLTIKNQPLLTDLRLAGTANIESLWLENIPSTSIDARALVAQMKYNSAVRIIGMDEKYESWEDIKAFYELLDTMSGLDYEGLTVDKAQVTGKIWVPDIPYADYVELSAKYPEVVINTDAIVCTIKFINEGEVHNTQNINQGFTGSVPEDPTKSETQQYYYIFNKWVTDEGKPWDVNDPIMRNMTITATYDTFVQQYKVIYQTNSDVILVEPTEVTMYYGDTLAEPTVLGIPEGVTFIGWYTPEGSMWVFDGENPTKVLGHITLTARWEDANKPWATVLRTSYNTFSYEAQDNLGISAWAVVHNSEAAPETWNEIKPVAHLTGEYTISSAGDHWFWVTDHAGNTASAKITAHPITYSPAIGTDTIQLSENGEVLTDFAIDGTMVEVFAELDSHYEHLHIEVNGDGVENNSEHLINQAFTITTSCSPKDYTVIFVTGKEVNGAEVASQIITYLHKPEQPLALYHVGYIISNWYKEPELINRWDFDVDVIEGPTTLYAEWQEYRTPTRIKIKIPFDINAVEDSNTSELDPYTISVNYSQNRSHDVKVYFGDSSEEFSSATTIYATSITHTYSEPGEYIVEIYGTPHGYALGGSFTKQTVDPACCIEDIEFAWDVTTTRDYAFKGANITELRLTPYMTSIATAAFAVCRKITKLDIPSSIYRLGSQAFENCSGLVGDLLIPKTISEVGNNVFANCSGLNSIIFEENGALREISSFFANNSGIKELIVPSYIQHIKSEAFGNCGKLEKVVLMNPNLTMGERVFNSTVKLKSAGPINWSIGPGKSDNYDIEYAWVEKIPDYAFSAGVNFRQSYLTNVAFPDTLIEIGHSAFRGAGLKQVTFPESLKTIGEEAFYFTALLDLDVPATVTSVGARAFGFNSSLNSAILRYGGSLVTVQAPGDGWFFGCDSTLMPKIPVALVRDPVYLTEQYGPHWNVYAHNKDTNEIFILNYTGISG